MHLEKLGKEITVIRVPISLLRTIMLDWIIVHGKLSFRTWTATDGAGDTSIFTQNIIIVDPVSEIDCPDDVTF